MVRVRDAIVDVRIDLRYSGANNFTGEQVYAFQDAYLRQGTVKKLVKVQAALKEHGYGLLIWDAYRPASAQFKLWEAMPDADFVADPNEGHSSHSSGGTVDVCLVLPNGSIPEMPSAYDTFDATADRDYSDVSETAAANAALLEKTMTDAGFVPYDREWWHFTDSDTYGYDDVSELKLPTGWQVSCITDCEEYVTMRKTPDYEGEELRRIQNEERLVIVSFIGDFIRVRYYDQEGFVSAQYIRYGSTIENGVKPT
ncbi:MAG: D-alanyl-D-alanine carboxypeptidase family protein [Oscillospiraceae bacterium]|nr:D-alanyl-D-alanine carboxypeptidase family protein [Oscillospiraceae bacterium]